LTRVSDGNPRRRLLIGSKALKAVPVEIGAHCNTSCESKLPTKVACHAYSVIKVPSISGQKKKGLALARPFVVALFNPEA
jgi:hypothetical protein